MSNSTDNPLHSRIIGGIKLMVNDIVREEADEAFKRVFDRVNKLAGGVATRVASWVDFEKREDRLVITVRTSLLKYEERLGE